MGDQAVVVFARVMIVVGSCLWVLIGTAVTVGGLAWGRSLWAQADTLQHAAGRSALEGEGREP